MSTASTNNHKVKADKVKFAGPNKKTLVGILVSSLPSTNVVDCSNNRKIIIFVHGLWQHKNISFLRKFGNLIPADPAFKCMNTFRFDCRGLGESEGVTKYTPHYNNLEDLKCAVKYLTNEKGLSVECIFGYSAGGNVSTMFAADDCGRVPYIVNASGRFYMDGIEDTLPTEDLSSLKNSGKFKFKFTKRGQNQEVLSTMEDIALFKGIDMKKYCTQIPAKTRVLCIHGLSDKRVPVKDAAGFVTEITNVSQILIPFCTHEYTLEETGDDNDDDMKKKQSLPPVQDILYNGFRKWILEDADNLTRQRKMAYSKI